MPIRLEEKNDYFEVENLTREAFWNVYQPGCLEHLILHKLRGDACFVPELDYVLEQDGKIIAHIAYAKGVRTSAGGEKEPLLLFGPVSVLPSYQGRGLGEAIIRYTLDKAEQMGYPAVVITGDPEYYRKFGFESAAKYGLQHEALTSPEERKFFLIRVFDQERAGSLAGAYVDPACYQVEEKELEAFDCRFPPKRKERRPGQLE